MFTGMCISYFNILKIYPPPCLPKQNIDINIDINFNRSSYKSTFSVLIIFDRTFEKKHDGRMAHNQTFNIAVPTN